MYKRAVFSLIFERMREKRKFIQILAGPRQVGKTTLARQILDELDSPHHYASADEPSLQDHSWLDQQWEQARLKSNKGQHEVILILDEIQKVPQWSQYIKAHWDQDTLQNLPIKTILLGSSPLLISKGLTESLAGRFEIIPVTHWSWPEMRDGFGYTLEQYILFGGYPGAASLIHDPARWRHYLLDSLIETTVSRDILLMTQVNKPALLRRLFFLACEYSGQIISYQKLTGQLQDAGNTTTVAHYLDLLAGAGLATGLQQYSGNVLRKRSSSPKLIALNTGLISAVMNLPMPPDHLEPTLWGRMVESALGAHFINSGQSDFIETCYWRKQNHEVDFILQYQNQRIAFEIKSHARATTLPGMDAFSKEYPACKKYLIGGQGVPLEEALSRPARDWF